MRLDTRDKPHLQFQLLLPLSLDTLSDRYAIRNKQREVSIITSPGFALSVACRIEKTQELTMSPIIILFTDPAT
jgi:hypothetical protein